MSKLHQACTLALLATYSGCDDHAKPQLGDPAITVVHERLSGGALLASWGSTPYQVFFAGGAAPLLSPSGAVCANGARELLEFDGFSWSFLSTTPTLCAAPGDGGMVDCAPDGGNASDDGGVRDGGVPDGGPDLMPAPPMPIDGGDCPCPGDMGAVCGPQVTDPALRQGPLRAIYGFSPREFYAAGDDGVMLRIRSDSIEKMSIGDDTAPTFSAIWGSSESDVWAVGFIILPGNTTASPRIYHHDGAGWRRNPDLPATGGRLLSVWGASPDRVWAVGEAGVIFYFDGNGWQQQFVRPTDISEPLTSVAGKNEREVFAVGGENRPVIVGYDGTEWRELKTEARSAIDNERRPFSTRLLAVNYVGVSDLFAVGGQDGFIAVGEKMNDLTIFPEIVSSFLLKNASMHTIVPYFFGGFMLAGGNLFEQDAKDLHGTLVSIGPAITRSFAPRVDVDGSSEFKTAAPPASVGGGGGGGGW